MNLKEALARGKLKQFAKEHEIKAADYTDPRVTQHFSGRDCGRRWVTRGTDVPLKHLPQWPR
jgi:hypothetical protein